MRQLSKIAAARRHGIPNNLAIRFTKARPAQTEGGGLQNPKMTARQLKEV
jgi:hypothetical protein